MPNAEKKPARPGTTPITPVRLTESDRAQIEAVRAYHGLPTVAAAIRYAVEREYRRIRRARG